MIRGFNENKKWKGEEILIRRPHSLPDLNVQVEKVIVTMDVDLQDDPKVNINCKLCRLLESLKWGGLT